MPRSIRASATSEGAMTDTTDPPRKASVLAAQSARRFLHQAAGRHGRAAGAAGDAVRRHICRTHRALRSDPQRHGQHAAAAELEASARHRPVRPRHLLAHHLRRAHRADHRPVLAFLGCTVGAFIGAASAYFGGKIDNAIQRCIDLMLSFPADRAGAGGGRGARPQPRSSGSTSTSSSRSRSRSCRRSRA